MQFRTNWVWFRFLTFDLFCHNNLQSFQSNVWSIILHLRLLLVDKNWIKFKFCFYYITVCHKKRRTSWSTFLLADNTWEILVSKGWFLWLVFLVYLKQFTLMPMIYLKHVRLGNVCGFEALAYLVYFFKWSYGFMHSIW